MNITKSEVDKILIPPKGIAGQTGQKRYYDDKLKGFGIRVTSGGAKTFFVEKLVLGKLRRIKVGRYGELTVEQARKEAQKLLGKIAAGVDPIAEKQAAKAQAVTLNEAFEDYKKARKSLKPTTLYGYKHVIETALADWSSKSLFSISKDDVMKKHGVLGKENGPAYANLTMRVLRAIFNFAMEQYEDAQGKPIITENPVKRLSKTRAWYRVKRRKNYIAPNQLYDWHQSLFKLKNDVIKDYLLTILLTGLRRNEAAMLKKTQVNLTAKTLIIPDPKNNEPHILPLTNRLCDILKRRIDSSSNQYIFPGDGKEGYLVEPRKQMKQIIDETNIQFTVHDLRRTFITIAESLDISAYSLKRLLNHKINNSDVTAGYIITDVERLRKPMQQINNFILKKCLEKPKEKSSSILSV